MTLGSTISTRTSPADITVSRTADSDDIAACLALRTEVFIGEQGVPEAEEIDGLDDSAIHLLVRLKGEPAGTLRLRRIGETAKVERVCVAARFRGQGLANALTRAALNEITSWGGITRVALNAQTDAIGLYARHGFVAYGPVFDDAGIPHRAMQRDL